MLCRLSFMQLASKQLHARIWRWDQPSHPVLKPEDGPFLLTWKYTTTPTASIPTPWKVTESSWSHLQFPELVEQACDQLLHPSLWHPPFLGKPEGNWSISGHSLWLQSLLLLLHFLETVSTTSPGSHVTSCAVLYLRMPNDLPHSRSFCSCHESSGKQRDGSILRQTLDKGTAVLCWHLLVVDMGKEWLWVDIWLSVKPAFFNTLLKAQSDNWRIESIKGGLNKRYSCLYIVLSQNLSPSAFPSWVLWT